MTSHVARCRDGAEMILIRPGFIVPFLLLFWPLACASSHSPCPAMVTTEQAVLTDGGDLSDLADGGPSAGCVALCGIYALECSSNHPCGWRSSECV